MRHDAVELEPYHRREKQLLSLGGTIASTVPSLGGTKFPICGPVRLTASCSSRLDQPRPELTGLTGGQQPLSCSPWLRLLSTRLIGWLPRLHKPAAALPVSTYPAISPHHHYHHPLSLSIPSGSSSFSSSAIPTRSVFSIFFYCPLSLTSYPLLLHRSQPPQTPSMDRITLGRLSYCLEVHILQYRKLTCHHLKLMTILTRCMF